MNIFVLNENPVIAAQDHCDKHVVKMILEGAQMMSFSHHAVGSTVPGMYAISKSHMSHPCTLWARKSSANYMWLYELTRALCEQYTDRYGKIHKTDRVAMRHLWRIPPGYKKHNLTRHALCMPEEFHQANVVEAYRDFYVTKPFTHTNYLHSPQPLWLLHRIGKT